MSAPVVIFGSGGHARVVIDTIRQAGRYHPVACFGREAGDVLGVPILDDGQAAGVFADGVRLAFVAVGATALRGRLAGQATAIGYDLVNVISPHAYVSPSASLGAGVLVCAGAVIHPDCVVGDLSIINTRSSVDHECRVGALCHVAPGATLCGNVTVGDRSWIGAGATVIEQRNIADDVVIGAGAVVVQDIAQSGSKALGVPARVVVAH